MLFDCVKKMDRMENVSTLSDASIMKAEHDKIWVAAEDASEGRNIRFIRATVIDP